MERGSVLSIARVRPDQRQQQKEEEALEADEAAKPHDDISLDTTSTKSLEARTQLLRVETPQSHIKHPPLQEVSRS